MVNKESPGRAGRGLRPAAAGEAQLKRFMSTTETILCQVERGLSRPVNPRGAKTSRRSYHAWRLLLFRARHRSSHSYLRAKESHRRSRATKSAFVNGSLAALAI